MRSLGTRSSIARAAGARRRSRRWLRGSLLTAVAAIVATGIGGCSMLLDADWNWKRTSAEPPPDTTDLEVLYGKIASTYGQLKLPGTAEVSNLQRAEAVSIADWVICLRQDGPDGIHYYSFFVKKADIVEYRVAVLMDNCERQAFQPIRLPAAGPTSAQRTN